MKPIKKRVKRRVQNSFKQNNIGQDIDFETLLETIVPSYHQQLQFADTELEALLDSFYPFHKKLDEVDQKKITGFCQNILYDLETLMPSYRDLDELHQKILASNYLNIIKIKQKSNILQIKLIEAYADKSVIDQSGDQQEISVNHGIVQIISEIGPYILDIDIQFLSQKGIHTLHIHDKVTGKTVARITYLNGTLIVKGHNQPLELNIKGSHVLDNCFIDNPKSSVDILSCNIEVRDFFHLHVSSSHIKKGVKISGKNLLLESENKINMDPNTTVHADKDLIILGKDLWTYGNLYSDGNSFILIEKNIFFRQGSNCRAKGILNLSAENHYCHGKLHAKQLQITSSKYCNFVESSDLTAENHILITGNEVICQGKINSGNEFHLKTSGNTTFWKRSHVKAQQIQFNVEKKLSVQKTATLTAGSIAQIRNKNSIIEGTVVSGGELSIKTSNEIILNKFGKLSADLFIQLESRLLTIKNEVQSGGQLTIYASNLNLERNGKINAHQNIGIISSSVYSRGKIKANNHCQVFVVYKLLVEQGSDWTAKNDLSIEARSSKIYGNLASEESDLIMSTNNGCTLYKGTKCSAGRNIIVSADKLWSSAILCAKNKVNIAVNKYFIHGLTDISLESLKNNAFKACIRAEHVNIVTSVYVNLFNFISSKNCNLACLLDMSIGSFTYATHSNSNYLIRLGITTLHIPNFERSCEVFYYTGAKGAAYLQELMEQSIKIRNLKKLFDSITNFKETFATIREFNYEQILSELLQSQSLNMMIKFIGLLIPQVRNVIESVYNTGQLILNYKKIKNDIFKLKTIREENNQELQMRDIIPIIVKANNFMKQITRNSVSFMTMIDAKKSDKSILNKENKNKSSEIVKRLPIALKGAITTAFSPMVPNKKSWGILDYSIGFDLAANINEQSLYSYYNAKYQFAYRLTESFRKGYFSGVKFAAYGSFKGHSMTIADRMHFKLGLYISLLEDMTQMEDSIITANNAYVQAKNNYLYGKQTYANNSTIRFERQIVGEDSESADKWTQTTHNMIMEPTDNHDSEFVEEGNSEFLDDMEPQNNKIPELRAITEHESLLVPGYKSPKSNMSHHGFFSGGNTQNTSKRVIAFGYGIFALANLPTERPANCKSKNEHTIRQER